MAIAPTPLIAGPPRVGLPYGLFSVFSPRPNGADRWEVGGVRWESDYGGSLNDLGSPECDPADQEGFPLESTTSTYIGTAKSFSLYSMYECTPIGNTLEYAQSRAVRDLELHEEARVESVLWGDGDHATTQMTGISLGSMTLLEGVATLEQRFAEAYGSQGVIHMSRYNASIFAKRGKLEKRGGRLYTALDTPVVAGTGYADDRVVITSQLFGYRSDIFPGDTGGAGLDRGQNNLKSVAMRSYLVGFDSTIYEFNVADEGGSVGPAGKSAYEIAVDNGFAGTEAEWLTSLVGEAGTAATVTVGNVTTGAPGSQAAVTNTGTPEAAVFDIAIPRGNPGAPGDDGVVQTIAAGTGITVDSTDPANPVVSSTA